MEKGYKTIYKRYKTAIKGMRQVQGGYKGYEVGTRGMRQVQGYETGMRWV